MKNKKTSNVYKFPVKQLQPETVDINDCITVGKDGFIIQRVQIDSHFAFKGDAVIIDRNDSGSGKDLMFCSCGGRTGIVPFHLAEIIKDSKTKVIGRITHIIREIK